MKLLMLLMILLLAISCENSASTETIELEIQNLSIDIDGEGTPTNGGSDDPSATTGGTGPVVVKGEKGGLPANPGTGVKYGVKYINNYGDAIRLEFTDRSADFVSKYDVKKGGSVIVYGYSVGLDANSECNVQYVSSYTTGSPLSEFDGERYTSIRVFQITKK